MPFFYETPSIIIIVNFNIRASINEYISFISSLIVNQLPYTKVRIIWIN